MQYRLSGEGPLTRELIDTRKSKQAQNFTLSDSGIIYGQPAYPSYASLESRIKSFSTNWQAENWPDNTELARAGFVYTGEGLSTRCYYCGIGIRDWGSHDCPWKRHAVLSPSCGHLRRCRGDSFINSARLASGESLDIDDDCPGEENNVILSFQTLSRLSRVLKLNAVAIEAAKDFVDSEESIRLGVSWLVIKGKTCFSATELFDAIEECESAGITLSETEPEEREELNRENESLRQPVSCKICMDAMACIVATPCGHMFSCPQCIAPLRTCAVCRAKIKGTVRAKLCTFNKETVE